jgi:hypothetical protein
MRYSTWWVVVDAWRSKPSSYLIATEDHMIAPSTQRDGAAGWCYYGRGGR